MAALVLLGGLSGSLNNVFTHITQVQSFVPLFVHGLIRTGLLTFGSMYCMFRLSREFGAVVLCAFPFVTGRIILCLWKASNTLIGTQLLSGALMLVMLFQNSSRGWPPSGTRIFAPFPRRKKSLTNRASVL